MWLGGLTAGLRDSTISSSLSDSTSTLRSQSELKEEEIEEIVPTTIPDPQLKTGSAIVQLQEPDVIASTKANNNPIINCVNTIADTSSGPIAPPRKKKKCKPQIPPSTLPIGKENIPGLSQVFIKIFVSLIYTL